MDALTYVRRLPVLLLLMVSCARSGRTEQLRAAQLEKCTIVGGSANPQPSGDAVTRCLILQYDWDGKQALAAGEAYQAHLDSIARQVAAIESSAAARIHDSVNQAFRARMAVVDRWLECALAMNQQVIAGAPYEGYVSDSIVARCSRRVRLTVALIDEYKDAHPDLDAERQWWLANKLEALQPRPSP